VPTLLQRFQDIIDHSLVHHTSFLVILQPGVVCPIFKVEAASCRTEWVVGHNMVEGFQGFL